MAPKFPNPDPPTDKVRDRLDQFIEVAGRAVYPPLAVAPSPTTAGQVWWDISDTVKIRNEANTAWASLATTMGAVSFGEAQTLTSGQKTQALSNIGASAFGVDFQQVDVKGTRTYSVNYTNTTGHPLLVSVSWDLISGGRSLTMFVDNSEIAQAGMSENGIAFISGFVPAGSSYRIEGDGLSGTGGRWWYEYKRV